MRLLAHGGNEYAERRRIGSWAPIAAGPLEDTYGLSGDSLSFGCGLLENNLVLVIRQAQKQGQRLYAYSLLLDPGETLWERFHWNGASLVLALFGGVEPGESAPDCFGRQLLEQPEEIDEGKLAFMVEGLAVPRIKPEQGASSLLSLLLGAIYSSEPVTAAPRSIGMEGRPGIAQAASTLQALAPSFRAGLGWLIGGSAVHSRPFGAHLVVDDWLTQNAPPVGEHVVNGRWIRSAWETLAEHESYKRIVIEKQETPIWKWEEIWRKSPAVSLKRVHYLAEALRMSSPNDEIVTVIENALDEDGPLEREIRDAVHRRVASRSGPLNRNLTLFLLRDHFDKDLPVEEGTVRRFDEPTVVEFYTDDRRRILPSPESGSPLLRAQVRAEIWLKLISTEPNALAIPGLLRSAYDDLRYDGTLQPRVAEILFASIDRSVALTNSLEMWIAHRRDKILGPLIRECLQAESLRRAVAQADAWPRDYLAFGLDSGGVGFAEIDVPAQTVQRLVAEIARLSISENGLKQDAQEWLCDLARSPLRRKLPIEDKLTLGESLSSGWENFQAMLELFWGTSQATARAGAGPSEREVLVAELIGLTKMEFHYDCVPNLRGLIGFLGGLPEEAISALASLRPRMKGNDITGWMEGWEKLSPRDVYQQELVRQVMHSDKQFQIPTLLSRLNGDEKRTELFRELFFGDSSLADEEISRRCERSIDHALTKDSTLVERIAAAFDDFEMDQSKRNIFFRRHCDRTNFLDKLFECLYEDSRQLVVTIIFTLNYDRLEGQACRYYNDSTKMNVQLTPYRRAVLRFVLSAEGTPLKDAIVKHQDLRSASYVEERVKTALGPSGVREAQKRRSSRPDIEDRETKPARKSFWRRLFSD